MTVIELMDALSARGVKLRVEDGSLRFRAAKGALTPELRQQIGLHKEKIIRVLSHTDPNRAAPPIPTAPRGGPLPLSFAQKRLWFIDQLEPGNPVYNIVSVVDLKGHLDPDRLEGALHRIQVRHEPLRTTFPECDNQPVQLIHEDALTPMAYHDLSAHDDPEPALDVLATTEANLPFNLTEGPLFRHSLVHVAPNHHVLLLTLHHIIADGWSMEVLVRELTGFYADPQLVLPPLVCQYTDFAVWQQEYLADSPREQGLAWWRSELAGLPTLELPHDRPRPARQEFHGTVAHFTLPSGLGAKVKDFAARNQTTPFTVLLAGFALLLSRYSGQHDLPIGTPVAGRDRAELEPLIGLFVNMLVLRVRLQDGSRPLSFREIVARLNTTTREAQTHADIPFEKLVEEFEPERDLSRAPLFQVAFSYQTRSARSVSLSGLSIEARDAHRDRAHYDLLLTIMEADAGEVMRGSFTYSTDLFEGPTIYGWQQRLASLLESALRDPNRPFPKLPLLSAAEEAVIRNDWNATDSLYPTDHHIVDLFREQAARHPEAPALVFEDLTLSYSDLEGRAGALARRLLAQKDASERLIGIFLEPSPDLYIAQLAVLMSGGTYVPMDPASPQARLAHMVPGLDLVISNAELAPRLPQVAQLLIGKDGTAEPPAISVSPDQLAYVMYTSGSTGRPKGVSVPHRAVVRLVRDTNYIAIDRTDVIIQGATTVFDAATFEIWGALLNGAALAVLDRDIMLSAEDLSAAIKRRSATALFLTTALFNQLVRQKADVFSDLENLLFGGEMVDPEQVRAVLAAGAPTNFNHVYGPTENTTFSTWYPVRKNGVGADDLNVPIGSPLANSRAYIVDSWGELAAPGVPGELFLGGHGLARGYLNEPAQTAERFVPDPFGKQSGARLYRSGDLAAFREDGSIVFRGRVDHQIKLRGFRIEPGEIEAALRNHHRVTQAHVMVREDRPGDRRLTAYLIAGGEGELDPESLREHLQGHLPEYMIPAAIVVLDAFPLNANGKIDKRLLPVPDSPSGQEQAYTAPRTPAEEILCAIFAEVLAVTRIGIHDRFFDLGGHSLLATQAMSRIRESFRQELPLRLLFEKPTVAGIAAAIQSGAGLAQRPPIVPIGRDQPDGPPLSFTQQRLWFIDQMGTNRSAYNIPLAIRLAGPCRLEAVISALNHVIARHEVMRSLYPNVNGQPCQRFLEQLVLAPQLIDLRGLSPEVREAELGRLALAETRIPFSLADGPLVRAAIALTAEEECVLLLSMHHIIADGWSMGILIREVNEVYEAAIADRTLQLPDLPIQYADFASWQRQWLREEVLEEQLAYWKTKLGGAPPHITLPTDYPRPERQSFAGAFVPWILPANLADALLACSASWSATPFMILLAVYKHLLARHAGQNDVVVGSPIAGRGIEATESLIGCFINAIALRTEMDPNASFRDLVAAVRDTTLEAYAHQDIPFDKLVDELQVERDLSRNPIYQVNFLFFNFPKSRRGVSTLEMSVIDVDPGLVHHELACHFNQPEPGQPIHGGWSYASDLFLPATIEHMARHYQTLLERVLTEPDRPLTTISLTEAGQRGLLLDRWRKEAPRNDACLHRLFEAQVVRTPQATAVIDETGRVDYADINARANRLAHHIIAAGAGPEQRVGILLERGLEGAIAILATLKAGAAYVPLDLNDPPERLCYLVEASNLDLLITLDRLPTPAECEGAVICIDSQAEAIAARPSHNPNVAVSPDNLCFIVFTSGSSGRPKGVANHHRAVVHFLAAHDRAVYGGMTGPLRVSQTARFSFDASVKQLGRLLEGDTIHLVPDPVRHDGGAMLQLVEQYDLQVVDCTPSMLRLIIDAGLLTRTGPPERVLLAGEAIDEALWRQLAAHPHIRFYNTYGPTEGTVVSTATLIAPDLKPHLGQPFPNGRLFVLDTMMVPVPDGIAGQIYLGGAGLSRGYIDRPDLTATAFIPNPHGDQPGARLYATGDLARVRLGDGHLEYLGRIDRQVKLRGIRIELGEIEELLSEHEQVRATRALIREVGPGDQRLIAYVVADGEPNSANLRAHLETRLPEPMIPNAVIPIEAFPLTPNGKLDYGALPLPDRDKTTAYVAPRNEIEEQLAVIWREVLGIERIGVDDVFFQIGGHSLLAVKVLARIRRQMGIKLTPPSIFQQPTISGLAEIITLMTSVADNHSGDEEYEEEGEL